MLAESAVLPAQAANRYLNKGENTYYKPAADGGIEMAGDVKLARAPKKEDFAPALAGLSLLVGTMTPSGTVKQEDIDTLKDKIAAIDRKTATPEQVRQAIADTARMFYAAGKKWTEMKTELTNFTRLNETVKTAVDEVQKEVKKAEEKEKNLQARTNYARQLAIKLEEIKDKINSGKQDELLALANELKTKPREELTDGYLTKKTEETARFLLGAGMELEEVNNCLRRLQGRLPNAIIDNALSTITRELKAKPKLVEARAELPAPPVEAVEETPPTLAPAIETRVEKTEREIMQEHDEGITGRGFEYIKENIKLNDIAVLLRSEYISDENKKILEAYKFDSNIKAGGTDYLKGLSGEEKTRLGEVRGLLSDEAKKTLEEFERVKVAEKPKRGEEVTETDRQAQKRVDELLEAENARAHLEKLSRADYELLKDYAALKLNDDATRANGVITDFEAKKKEAEKLEGELADLAKAIIDLQGNRMLGKKEFARQARELAELREEVASYHANVEDIVSAGKGEVGALKKRMGNVRGRVTEIEGEIKVAEEEQDKKAKETALKQQKEFLGKRDKMEAEVNAAEKKEGGGGVAYLYGNENVYYFLHANEGLLSEETRKILKAYEYDLKIRRHGTDFLEPLVKTGEITRVFELSELMSDEAKGTVKKFEGEYREALEGAVKEFVKKTRERFDELKAYLAEQYGRDAAEKYLEDWKKKLEQAEAVRLKDLDASGLRKALEEAKTLVREMPSKEVVQKYAMLAAQDVAYLEKMLKPENPNTVRYAITPEWMGMTRALISRMDSHAKNTTYGEFYRQYLGKEKIDLEALKTLATFLEQQQQLFQNGLMFLERQIVIEEPDREEIRKQLGLLEEVVKGFRDGKKAGAALKLIEQYNMEKRALCLFYSGWHGATIEGYFAKMKEIISDENWPEYLSRREIFRNVTTQRAALEAAGILVGGMAETAGFRESLRGATGTAGEQFLSGAQIDSRFGNVSPENQQKVMAEMEARFGRNWQEGLKPIDATGKTSDEVAREQARQSDELLQLQGLVGKYDRTIYGYDVYNDFLKLNLDAQYEFLKVMQEHYGNAFAQLADEDLRKVGVLLKHLQDVMPSHQPLLLEQIGKTMLDYSPQTIDAVMGAITGFSTMFYGGYYEGLTNYYYSLPKKIKELYPTAFALKEGIKLEPESVIIQMPTEQEEYVQIYYPSAQITLQVPKPIYNAFFQYPITSIAVAIPPEILRAQTAPPDVLRVDRAYFEEDVLNMVVTQPLPTIAPPMLLTRLEKLGPDWLPPVGELEHLLLQINGAYDNFEVSQDVGFPGRPTTTMVRTHTGNRVQGGLGAGWYGGNGRFEYTEEQSIETTTTPKWGDDGRPVVDENGNVASETSTTRGITRTGSGTARNMPLPEAIGGGLLQFDGNVEVHEATEEETNVERMLVSAIQQMNGGARRAVYVEKTHEGLYKAYVFDRTSSGTFVLTHVQEMTYEEQQKRYGFTREELDGKDHVAKWYNQVHPALGETEFEVEGCIMFMGKASEMKGQGIGAAAQHKEWGSYALYERGHVVGTEERGGRVVVGINETLTPEEETSNFWSDTRFWTGRVYISGLKAGAKVDDQSYQFEGYVLENQKLRVKFFGGGLERHEIEEGERKGEWHCVGGAVADYKGEFGYVGGGVLYSLTADNIARTGFKGYYIDTSLRDYAVASYLAEQIRAGTQTYTGGTREEEERYIAALGVRTDFTVFDGVRALNPLSRLGIYARGIGAINKMNAQELKGGAIAVGRENGVWKLDFVEARGAYFEQTEKVEELEKKRLMGMYGVKTISGPFQAELYAPGFGEGRYTLKYGGFDVVRGWKREVKLVAGGAIRHRQVGDEVYYALWGGARLKPNPYSTPFIVASVEERKKERKGIEEKPVTTQQAMAGYIVNLTPESVYDSRWYLLFGASEIYQKYSKDLTAVQADLQASLMYAEALRTAQATLGVFAWDRWAHPDKIATSGYGITEDETYKYGANLRVTYHDMVGRLGIFDAGIPVNVNALIQAYWQGQRYPANRVDRFRINYMLEFGVSYW